MRSYSFRPRDCRSRFHPRLYGRMSGSIRRLRAHSTKLLRPSTLQTHSEDLGLPHLERYCPYQWTCQGFCRSSYMYPKEFHPLLYPLPTAQALLISALRRLLPVLMRSYPQTRLQGRSADSGSSRPFGRNSPPCPAAGPDRRSDRSYPA